MSKSHDKRRTSNYSTVYVGVALYSSPHTVHVLKMMLNRVAN